ncbi:quercetin 2,3-dioxygenase [Rubrivirga marina]|uniref:Cupin type-2 domain-containing protein n=1 Tax=Rubrivirga marina TaxID=1196024 RepID=A0A271IUY6_9BACT|nr:quercetin 2,3-dioxygenase [Rubrivirga marina]PAP75056.1 hypothetical protein BSZ37_00615 [Rubrivirga marina]
MEIEALPTLLTSPRRVHYVGPERVEVLLSTDETDGQFGMFTSDVPPASGPPPHVHERESETLYVASGRFEFWVDGETVVCDPGQVAHVPAGVPHTFRNLSEHESRLVVVVAPGGFEGYFAAVGTPEPGVVDGEVVERLMAAAPDFHIAFLPPPSAAGAR